MTILKQITNHKKAYNKFLIFLKTRDIKNINSYLNVRDELSYGFLLEFIHSYNANVIILKDSINIIVGKSNVFGIILKHKGLNFIYYEKTSNQNYTTKLNCAILNFFKLLDENIL